MAKTSIRIDAEFLIGVQVTQMKASTVRTSREGDHRFYVSASICVAIILVVGFVPNYTMRLSRHDPNLTWLVHIHGLLSASWIGLFLTQSLLIAGKRLGLHRRLGMVGAVLAALVFSTGLATLLNAAYRSGPAMDAAHGVRYIYMLIAFDGAGLLVFACLVATAILLRNDGGWHKRLMLLAVLSLLGPAFGRITSYANGMQGDDDLAVLLLCAACVFIPCVIDAIRLRQLHFAFVWGGGLVLGMYLLTFLAKMQL